MKIDYSKDKLLTEFSLKTLQDRYLIPSESSPQEAFARAARTFADDDVSSGDGGVSNDSSTIEDDG